MAWFRRGDALLLAGIVLLALLFWLAPRGQSAGEGRWVAVTLEGRTARYALSEDREIPLLGGGGFNLLVIRDGAAYVAEADCPGQECVHSGRISRPGQSLVCLPHRLLVAVEGDDGLDAVVR